jgi:hypothetical protein
MSLSHSYTKELELLITDTLLPVYEKYYKAKGILTPLKDINPELLKLIKVRKTLPALLRPKEKQTCKAE